MRERSKSAAGAPGQASAIGCGWEDSFRLFRSLTTSPDARNGEHFVRADARHSESWAVIDRPYSGRGRFAALTLGKELFGVAGRRPLKSRRLRTPEACRRVAPGGAAATPGVIFIPRIAP